MVEPSPRERVQRMAEEGVLTPNQADMLRDSLDGANGGESGGPRCPRGPWAR